ncbi:MAG: hypothetical protein QGD89_04890 [Actinomycetota bacterium]|nr:hypothetical protein [Actinomycetota bacterium]
MIENDAGAVWNEGFARESRACTTLVRPWGAAHSGHLCPTEASWEHATQIGLSHEVQLSPVMRFGCR